MKKILLFVFLSTLLYCKKEPTIIPDNIPINGKYVSTIQIENYVNKLFIDLLGREPLDSESEIEVALLKESKLSVESRETLVIKLQSNTDFIDGDTSYQMAYYQRIYEMVELKMLEGVEHSYMRSKISQKTNLLESAILDGDSASATILRKDIQELKNIFSIREDYRLGLIDMDEIFARLIDNMIYDLINMNTFNFINASFEDLFFRLPSIQEYNTGYDMVEHNVSGFILGKSGTNKEDYIAIITDSKEFYQGLIIWTYQMSLGRDPTAKEVYTLLEDFYITHDYQVLQQKIMITDEYAKF